jgi:hypothetical protein
MGKIIDDLNRQITSLEKQLQNKSISADEREFVQEELDEVRAELEKASKVIESGKPKKPKKPVAKKEPKKEVKKEAPKQEEKPKADETPSKKKYSQLEVGESLTDDDGNRIKRTKDTAYTLEYHQEKTVAHFDKKGNKWVVDCCEKKGIEFRADEIDTAIEKIIEGLDCHFEIKKRREIAKKRKAAAKKYDSLSETEKLENTIEKAAESVENRVEDIKEKGKSVSLDTAKDFFAEIKKMLSSIKEGINEKSERQKFIQLFKEFVAELQKELNEKFEDGGGIDSQEKDMLKSEYYIKFDVLFKKPVIHNAEISVIKSTRNNNYGSVQIRTSYQPLIEYLQENDLWVNVKSKLSRSDAKKILESFDFQKSDGYYEASDFHEDRYLLDNYKHSKEFVKALNLNYE